MTDLPAFNTVSETRHGPMIHNALDRYIGRSLARYGEYGEEEGTFLRSLVQPGGIVLDVGANIGVFTVQLARHVGPSGRVFAFEPQRLAYQALCGNIALNSLINAWGFHAAVGAAPGRIMVPVLDPFRETNIGGLSLGKWNQGDEVAVMTLDSLALPACHLIKIDVEGMELDVLVGGNRLIGASRPALYLENDRREKSPQVLAWLLGHGYRCWWHRPRLFNPANHRAISDNEFGVIASTNVLAFPRESGRSADLPEITTPDDWYK